MIAIKAIENCNLGRSIQREIRFLKMTEQMPGIIRTYDIQMTSELVLIIMELMQGDIDSLQGWSNPIEADEFEEHMLWHLLTDMSTALYNLHRMGISHNDIKPANLLWTQGSGRFVFKLSDGGCSSMTKTLQSQISLSTSGNDQ